ncbi:MAG: SHOCT domain-containing protein [Actinomycetota bacterium]|nr:SHOCT domain-containing protein [Actinomycetota bacterium]
MGLFDFLRRKDENAIPQPGTPEFEAVVSGSALPDEQSVQMGEGGWANTSDVNEALRRLGVDTSQEQDEQRPSQTIDLDGSEAREKVEGVLREHGIDPDRQGQQIDASTVPGLQKAILAALGISGIRIPNAEGFGGGISAPKADPADQVEHLARKRDAGEITDAEFQAAKGKLLE